MSDPRKPNGGPDARLRHHRGRDVGLGGHHDDATLNHSIIMLHDQRFEARLGENLNVTRRLGFGGGKSGQRVRMDFFDFPQSTGREDRRTARNCCKNRSEHHENDRPDHGVKITGL